MRIRDAANIGRVLIIIHLIISAGLSIFNILQMLSAITQGGGSAKYLVTSLMYLIATIFLDVALLVVFSSLARTEEQFLRDRSMHDAD